MKHNYNFSVIIFILLSIFDFSIQATNPKRGTTTIDPPNVKKCRVNNFILQKNFNASLYQGHWFIVSWNKHSVEVEHPFLSKFISIKNVEVYYKLRRDGNLRFFAGSMNFHMYCQQEETVAYVTNKTAPQKLMIQISPKVQYPHWVLQTDYTSYSIVYSCLKVAPDGMCAPGHAIVRTLNRKPAVHSSAQQAKIDHIIKRVCIDPSELKIVGYDGRCPEIDPENFPQRKILMEAICFISILIVLLVGIIYFFCRQSPAKKEKKKEHAK